MGISSFQTNTLPKPPNGCCGWHNEAEANASQGLSMLLADNVTESARWCLHGLICHPPNLSPSSTAIAAEALGLGLHPAASSVRGGNRHTSQGATICLDRSMTQEKAAAADANVCMGMLTTETCFMDVQKTTEVPVNADSHPGQQAPVHFWKVHKSLCMFGHSQHLLGTVCIHMWMSTFIIKQDFSGTLGMDSIYSHVSLLVATVITGVPLGRGFLSGELQSP